MGPNLEKIYIILLNILILNTFSLELNAQSAILLQNPSFEDAPSDASMPQGWMACAERTTPDILPGYWGVYLEADQGETYVGLITRENSTYESIGQRLPESLAQGQCYQMSLSLARSRKYTGYSAAVKLRIWVSDNKCDKQQMIYESPLIKNSDWENHSFEFIPEIEGKYIQLEAHISDELFNHKGNILMDNISSIVKCKRV